MTRCTNDAAKPQIFCCAALWRAPRKQQRPQRREPGPVDCEASPAHTASHQIETPKMARGSEFRFSPGTSGAFLFHTLSHDRNQPPSALVNYTTVNRVSLNWPRNEGWCRLGAPGFKPSRPELRPHNPGRGSFFANALERRATFSVVRIGRPGIGRRAIGCFTSTKAGATLDGSKLANV